MAELHGPTGGARDAASQVPRAPEAGDLAEKWAEARQWAGGQTSKKKYRMPSRQKPDSAVAGSSRRLTSRFYQTKTGHYLTGQYLQWTKNRPTAQCWGCQCQTQTRDHLFKVCPEWKGQQKILWVEVRKETGRRKYRHDPDLLADGRCSQAVLDFLSTTDVGRLAPAEEGAGSEVSEWERRERREGEEERKAEAEVEALGAVEEFGVGEELPLFPPMPPFMASVDED